MTITPHFDEILQRLQEVPIQPAEFLPRPIPPSEKIPDVLFFSESLHYTPSLEELLDIYLRNYTGRGIPKSHHVHAVNLDVVLSSDELAGRTHLPIRVPVFQVCDRCGGSGHAGFFGCDKCNGAGIMEETRTLDVIIPPIGPEGVTIPVSLKHLGIENLRLNLRVMPHA
ncbi:MAG: hypothetical protein ACM359_12720 [Bacillota bacterium]